MGKTDGSRGAWVLRLFLITFLAAVIALTGQSQALGQYADPGELATAASEDCSDNAAFMAMIEGEPGDAVDFGDLIDCGAKDLHSLVEAGQLEYVNIEPLGRAGSSENVLISFATANPMPEGGKVVVTLPEGFGVRADASGETEVILEVDGGSVSVEPREFGARSVTAVFSTPIEAGVSVVLTLTDIRHPEVSGPPGEGGSVVTKNHAADLIDSCIDGHDGCTIVYTDVKPGFLTDLVFDLKAGGVGDDLSHTAAGSTGEVTVSFTTKNPVPKDGWVIVAFPEGFEVGYETSVASDLSHFSAVIGQQFAADELPEWLQELLRQRTRGTNLRVPLYVTKGLEKDTTYTLTLDKIKNPPFTGYPQGGAIATYFHPKNCGGSGYEWCSDGTVIIDGACEETTASMRGDIWPWWYTDETGRPIPISECASGIVETNKITPGKLTKHGVVLVNKRAGGTGDVTVTFTLDNPLPAGGVIAITFPEGFVLDSKDTEAKLLEPNDEDVTVKVIEHKDSKKTTALIIRSVVPRYEFTEDSVVTLRLTNITNPQVSGQTHNFEIRTSVGKLYEVPQD
jgi:hypothetical protein